MKRTRRRYQMQGGNNSHKHRVYRLLQELYTMASTSSLLTDGAKLSIVYLYKTQFIVVITFTDGYKYINL
jgi:hypothetical protein